MIGVQGQGYPPAKTWSVSFGWRHQTSDRHFVGSDYQEERDEIGNQVINHVSLADLSIGYQASKRVSLSLGIPYFMGTRSQSLRNTNTTTEIERYQTQARGLGDITFTARRWLFDPDTHVAGNIMIGAGIKLPTGQDNVTDTFRVFSATPAPAGTVTNVVRTVDQSIQPGDGGYGIIADIASFRGFWEGKTVLYASGAYLAQPQEKSGVLTYRGAAGEQVMSIGDQYILRVGAAFPVPKTKSASFSLGIRSEGVRVKDLFGGSEGFRRPGVAVSLEPTLNIGKGRNSISVGVPYAIYRNRFISVPDAARGAHGDAAFADYLVTVGFTRSFGGK